MKKIVLINFINELEENKNTDLETLIQERLDKTLFNYIEDLRRSYNSIMIKKNRMVVIKELSKNGKI